ncbi:MAG: hypothetical protein ACTHWH_14935, partial [Marinobacter sp.]
MKLMPPSESVLRVERYHWRHPLITVALAITCTGVALADNVEQNESVVSDTAAELKPILVTADGDSDEIKQE